MVKLAIVRPVERRFRLAARDINVALVERERHRPVHVVLRACDECLERLAQRREPQSEVDDLGILQSDVLLEVRQLAIETERFQFAMRRQQQRAAGRLVAAARLDADEAVLDQVDAADSITRTDFVQDLDQRRPDRARRRLPRPAAIVEFDRHLLTSSAHPAATCPRPRRRQRRVVRIFQFAAFVADTCSRLRSRLWIFSRLCATGIPCCSA